MGTAILKPFAKKGKDEMKKEEENVLWDLPFTLIDGSEPVTLREIVKGKKCVMLVNVASKWTFSKVQYLSLRNLHEKYKDQGFEVVGFPCNQFMSQEPLDNLLIAKSVREKYEVVFPLSQKVCVNGKNTDKIFKYLRANSELYRPGKLSAKEVPWNFTKFIVDVEAKEVIFIDPRHMAESAEP